MITDRVNGRWWFRYAVESINLQVRSGGDTIASRLVINKRNLSRYSSYYLL